MHVTSRRRSPGDVWPSRARELPGFEVPRGEVAADEVTVDGSTKVLPVGPAMTAWCSALPLRNSGQLRNHWVQPLSQTPPRGLPMTVTGSPGSAIL